MGWSGTTVRSAPSGAPVPLPACRCRWSAVRHAQAVDNNKNDRLLGADVERLGKRSLVDVERDDGGTGLRVLDAPGHAAADHPPHDTAHFLDRTNSDQLTARAVQGALTGLGLEMCSSRRPPPLRWHRSQPWTPTALGLEDTKGRPGGTCGFVPASSWKWRRQNDFRGFRPQLSPGWQLFLSPRETPATAVLPPKDRQDTKGP